MLFVGSVAGGPSVEYERLQVPEQHYLATPAEGLPDRELWAAGPAGLRAKTAAGERPARAVLRAAHVEVLAGGTPGAAPEKYCLVPNLIVRRLANNTVVLRGSTELSLRFDRKDAADGFQRAVTAAAQDVAASLFAAVAPGHRVPPPGFTCSRPDFEVLASAIVVFHYAAWKENIQYSLCTAEIRWHDCAVVVGIWDADKKIAAILLDPRSDCSHAAGSCNVHVTDKTTSYDLVFPSPSVAEVWAAYISRIQAVEFEDRNMTTLRRQGRDAQAAFEASLAALSKAGSRPLLASTPDLHPRAPSSDLGATVFREQFKQAYGEKLDIPNLLKPGEHVGFLPKASDSVWVGGDCGSSSGSEYEEVKVKATEQAHGHARLGRTLPFFDGSAATRLP